MIFLPLAKYYTAEITAELDALEKEQLQKGRTLMTVDRSEYGKHIKEWQAIQDKVDAIHRQIEDQYIKDRGEDGLLEDVRKIVDTFTKETYLQATANRIEHINKLRADGTKEEDLAHLIELAEENYNNCCHYILYQLRVQLNGLAHNEEYTNKAIAIVEEKVSRWYVKPQPDYFPMAHGKATDALAFMSSKKAEIDRVAETSKIDMFEVELKLYALSANWGVGADKLWSTAIGVFTAQNDFRELRRSGKEPKTEVVIPLKEYATALGYDLTERATDTPEEAQTEKKRLKTQRDNARKTIKNDLNTLFESELKWDEKIKGKLQSFDRIRLVSRANLTRNGLIRISIGSDIANYLVERNLITQYPAKLLRISGTKPTAYYIGRKLAEYYHIDKNQLRGTNNRIGIPSLLAVSGLPSYEEVQEKDRGHWIERIKEPLERALDELTTEGILEDWEYTHAKAVELTEKEAYNITNYVDFSRLYLTFTLADPVEQPERIEAKEKARKEARERRRKKKS